MVQGSSCPFRHQEACKATTQACKFWQLGGCSNVECIFRHPPVAYRGQQPQQPQLCRYFQQGHCQFGAGCHFVHASPGAQPGGPNVSGAPTSNNAPASLMAGAPNMANSPNLGGMVAQNMPNFSGMAMRGGVVMPNLMNVQQPQLAGGFPRPGQPPLQFAPTIPSQPQMAQQLQQQQRMLLQHLQQAQQAQQAQQRPPQAQQRIPRQQPHQPQQSSPVKNGDIAGKRPLETDSLSSLPSASKAPRIGIVAASAAPIASAFSVSKTAPVSLAPKIVSAFGDSSAGNSTANPITFIATAGVTTPKQISGSQATTMRRPVPTNPATSLQVLNKPANSMRTDPASPPSSTMQKPPKTLEELKAEKRAKKEAALLASQEHKQKLLQAPSHSTPTQTTPVPTPIPTQTTQIPVQPLTPVSFQPVSLNPNQSLLASQLQQKQRKMELLRQLQIKAQMKVKSSLPVSQPLTSASVTPTTTTPTPIPIQVSTPTQTSALATQTPTTTARTQSTYVSPAVTNPRQIIKLKAITATTSPGHQEGVPLRIDRSFIPAAPLASTTTSSSTSIAMPTPALAPAQQSTQAPTVASTAQSSFSSTTSLPLLPASIFSSEIARQTLEDEDELRMMIEMVLAS